MSYFGRRLFMVGVFWFKKQIIMREVKFRTWIKPTDGLPEGLMFTEEDDTDYFMIGNGGMFAIVWDTEEYLDSDAFEIMQFTGLKDSKRTKEFPEGQEICEGDILKSESGDNTVHVYWGVHISKCGLDAFTTVGWLVENTKGIIDTLDKSFWNGEVIGNIHQNPELLTNKQKSK